MLPMWDGRTTNKRQGKIELLSHSASIWLSFAIFRKFEPNFKLLLRIEFHALGCVHKCTVFMPAAVLQTLQAEYASRHRYDWDTPRQEALLRGGRCAINW